MHLIISMPNGKRREAVVLAVGENRLRVVVAGHNDVVELRRNYGLWSCDLGEIEVEAMTADDRIDIIRLSADFCTEERAVGFERAVLA
jgi:hypothetical protein